MPYIAVFVSQLIEETASVLVKAPDRATAELIVKRAIDDTPLPGDPEVDTDFDWSDEPSDRVDYAATPRVLTTDETKYMNS